MSNNFLPAPPALSQSRKGGLQETLGRASVATIVRFGAPKSGPKNARHYSAVKSRYPHVSYTTHGHATPLASNPRIVETLETWAIRPPFQGFEKRSTPNGDSNPCRRLERDSRRGSSEPQRAERAKLRGSPDTANGSGHHDSERARDIRGMEPLAGIAFRAVHWRLRSPPIERERASSNIDEQNSGMTGICSPIVEHGLTSHTVLKSRSERQTTKHPARTTVVEMYRRLGWAHRWNRSLETRRGTSVKHDDASLDQTRHMRRLIVLSSQGREDQTELENRGCVRVNAVTSCRSA